MAETTEKRHIRTPEGRVSFPSVFTPTAFKKGSPLKYEITLLFREDPKTLEKGEKVADLTDMKQLLVEAGEAKWGTDRSKWPSPLKLPFRNGKEKEKHDGYDEGITFVRMSTQQLRHIVGPDRKPFAIPSDFYAGCYAHVIVDAFAWGEGKDAGISFGMGNVQKTRDGQPLGGGSTDPETDFEPIATEKTASTGGTADAGDPLAGLG